MFLTVKSKANLPFLLPQAQPHREHIASQATEADPCGDVVTLRKNRFRSHNFSCPKSAARSLCIHTALLALQDTGNRRTVTKCLLLIVPVVSL